MAISAAFTVNGAANPAAHTAAYGSTVTLQLSSVSGVQSVTFSIVGVSKSGMSIPAITAGGIPSGATSTFTLPTDPGDGQGRAYRVKCVVRNGYESDTRYAVVGAANAVGILPLVAGEELDRSSSVGWVDGVNVAMSMTLGDDAFITASSLDIYAAGYPSYSALRAAISGLSSGQTVIGRGRSSIADGGEGVWLYATTGGPYTDDGGSILTSSGGTESDALIRADRRVRRPEWYGAVGNGTTNDTAAFLAMAASSPLAVELGPRTYLLRDKIEFPGNCSVRGRGPGVTRLLWDASASDSGLSFLHSASPIDYGSIRDLDLVRSGVRGTGVALSVDGSATISSGSIQPRSRARFYVDNVRAIGTSVLTDSWLGGIEAVSVQGLRIGRFDFVGSYVSEPSWDADWGLYIHGAGTPVEINANELRLFAVKEAFKVGATGERVEGVMVDQLLALQCNKAIVWRGDGPHLSISGGHINAYEGGIDADTCSQLKIEGVLFYARADHAAGYKHIGLSNCLGPVIHGNTFVDLASSAGTATNIDLDNCDNASIGANFHQNGAVGIDIDAACGNVVVSPQSHASATTTRVVDAGANTNRIDSRQRFYSSGIGSSGDSRITASGGDGSMGSGSLTVDAAAFVVSGRVGTSSPSSNVTIDSLGPTTRQSNASVANAATFTATVSLGTNLREVETLWRVKVTYGGVTYSLAYITTFRRDGSGVVTLNGALAPCLPVGRYSPPPAVTVSASVSGTTGQLNILNSTGGAIAVNVDPSHTTSVIAA